MNDILFVCLGVNVYLMERSAKFGGYRSPWAVKKIAKRFHGKGAGMDYSKRLLTEAETLRNLTHPNIVGYRSLTKATDGTWCLAMEKAENSLMDLIEYRLEEGFGPVPPSHVLRVGVDIAQALHYLHGEKLLLHGDIKSGNVLVFGDFVIAKLCDFGVALPLDKANGNVKPGHFYVGTQSWSSPEALLQDCEEDVTVTSKADIFSYGLTIWETLTLSLPHADQLSDSCDDSEDEDSSYMESLGTRPPLPELPEEYSTAVQIFIGCTETDPSKRPLPEEIMSLWH